MEGVREYRHHIINRDTIHAIVREIRAFTALDENNDIPVAYLKLDTFIGNLWKGLVNIETTTFRGNKLLFQRQKGTKSILLHKFKMLAYLSVDELTEREMTGIYWVITEFFSDNKYNADPDSEVCFV